MLAYSPLAGGWLSGKNRKRKDVAGPGSPARLQRFPGRWDTSSPANAMKLDAADALGALADEAGLTLVQMAVAFAVRHPAVISTIIGPRTSEHLDVAPWIAEVWLFEDRRPGASSIVFTGAWLAA